MTICEGAPILLIILFLIQSYFYASGSQTGVRQGCSGGPQKILETLKEHTYLILLLLWLEAGILILRGT